MSDRPIARIDVVVHYQNGETEHLDVSTHAQAHSFARIMADHWAPRFQVTSSPFASLYSAPPIGPNTSVIDLHALRLEGLHNMLQRENTRFSEFIKETQATLDQLKEARDPDYTLTDALKDKTERLERDTFIGASSVNGRLMALQEHVRNLQGRIQALEPAKPTRLVPKRPSRAKAAPAKKPVFRKPSHRK